MRWSSSIRIKLTVASHLTGCGLRKSSFGRATARSINAFYPSMWMRCARNTPASRSSCTPNAVGRSARKPTPWARPSGSSTLSPTRRRDQCLPLERRSTWSIAWRSNLLPVARRSSPSTIPAAYALPCIASARSISPGLSRTCVEGRVVNRIQVREEVKLWARVALDRMLEIRA